MSRIGFGFKIITLQLKNDFYILNILKCQAFMTLYEIYQ